MRSNFTIFCALLRRDLMVMRKSIVGEFINGAILVIIQLITFGKLLPLIGMPQSLAAPLYIGSGLLFIILTRGYSLAMQIVYKIPFEGFGIIGYHLTLPISKWWLFAEYITFFVIETAVLTLPLLCIGTLILSTMVHFTIYSLPLFIAFYILTLICWGIFFVGSAFSYEFEWFRDNMWTRRLDILLACSSTFFPWEMVYAFSPVVSYCMLLNPVTYMVEGMRIALFGYTQFPPLFLCTVALLGSIIICCIRLKHGVLKTLDPV